MAIPLYKNYDPGLVVLNWKGILISGFAPDTMINAERNTDAYSQIVGAQGGVVDVRSRDKTGIVTFRLLAGSPTNDLLSAAMEADEALGLGFGPMLCKELLGTTLIQCENARLRRHASAEFAAEHGIREWVLQCPILRIFNGGLLT